jgi:hypothetical protein
MGGMLISWENQYYFQKTKFKRNKTNNVNILQQKCRSNLKIYKIQTQRIILIDL